MNRKKILIVDDSPVILKTLSMKLSSRGYTVITAEDGSAAVIAVRRERPDLILLDLSFPPDVAHGGGALWDGFLIMSWLRRIEEGKDVPILIITGGDPVKCKEKAMAAGAISFFSKPVNNDDLLAMIRKTLKLDGDPIQAEAPAPDKPA